MASADPNASDLEGRLRERFLEVERMLDELSRFDGSQYARSIRTLEGLVAGLVEQDEVNVTGGVTAGGNGSFGGTLTVTGQMTSPGVAGFNVTTLPGGRSTVWVHDSTGRLGQTTSSIVYKTNLEPVPFTAQQFLSVIPYLFEYIAQCDIRDNPDNPNYDPEYLVPVDVGMMAEHLVAAGLSPYVQFAADGVTPTNIDYATFGSHAALVIGRDHEVRLRAIESALSIRV